MGISASESGLSKVPELTLAFWIIKIATTTLGETGGDAVSMSMDLGYLVGTAIFALLFVVAVTIQIKVPRFEPPLYWLTIIASTTVGTTLADFATRSLGIGYAGGSTLLAALLVGCLALWYWTLGSVSINTVCTPREETFYWLTIMASQTLGTALGRSRLSRRRTHLQRTSRGGRRRLLVDESLANEPLLGGVHPDATPRRGRRRFSRQAHE